MLARSSPLSESLYSGLTSTMTSANTTFDTTFASANTKRWGTTRHADERLMRPRASRLKGGRCCSLNPPPFRIIFCRIYCTCVAMLYDYGKEVVGFKLGGAMVLVVGAAKSDDERHAAPMSQYDV